MGTGTPGCVFGTRDSGTEGCGDVCMGGRRDVGCGDVGTHGCGDVGTWGRGDARSGTRGGEKQKEPFSASNESKVARSQRGRLSTGRPPSVCVVCLRLELET